MKPLLFLFIWISLRGFAEQIEIRANLPGAPNCSFLLKASRANANHPFHARITGLPGSWRTGFVMAALGQHPRQLGSAYERDALGIRNFFEDSGFILQNAVETPTLDYPPADTDWEKFRAALTPAQKTEFAMALKVLRDPALGRLIVIEYAILMRDSRTSVQGQNLVLIWLHGTRSATLMARWISTPTHGYLANIFSRQGKPYFLLTTAEVKARD